MKTKFSAMRATNRAMGSRVVTPRGMTLVEIMIVVTIMASVMGVVGYFVFGALAQANIKTAGLEISQMEGMVNSYYLMSSPRRLPDALDELTAGPSPLTKKINVDPWGNPYIYNKVSNSEFTIISAGPDGQEGTEDDVGLDL